VCCTEGDYFEGRYISLFLFPVYLFSVAYPGIFFSRGSTDSVEDREDGDLGAAAPLSGGLEAAVIWYKKFHFI
jgi:hypothetical protein